MKRTVKTPFARLGLARLASDHWTALTLTFLLLPSVLPAQTLEHRYSFVSDASDSVGGSAWKGTIVPPGNVSGSAAIIDNGLSLPGGGGGGYSGYVSLPGGILVGDASITVECWVTQNAANEWGTIWDFGNNGNVNFELCPDPGRNNSDLLAAFTPNGGENDLDTPISFPDGAEQYVAVTYNNPTLTANLFYGGVLEGTLTLPNATYSPGSIGGAGGTAGNWLGNHVDGDTQFQGTVYELRIWNGVVPQRYVGASALLGPGTVVTNLTPTAASLSVASNVLGATDTEQGTVTVQLSETGTNNLPATVDATNWTTGNPNVLAVNSSGLISGVGVGTTTVRATVGGLTATSVPITVTPLTLVHRYSFVSDASDSVGGSAWNGTIVPPISGGAATITNGLNLPGNAGGGNGVSGYVSLPNGIVAGDSSVTVECWVQPNTENTWAEIWDFGSSGSVNFALIQDSPGPGNMRVAFNPNGDENDIDAPTYLPTGSEQYVAVTYNNFTVTGNLYLNGVLDGTTVFPNTTYSPGSIGGAGGTTEDALGNDVFGDPQFDGTIYELRIWDGAVSPVYVAVSAAAGSSVVVTNLTPLYLAVTVVTNMVGAQTQQATVTGNFAQASGVTLTGAATNWSSSNPSILTVSGSGLITGLSGGNATVSATVGGVTATSASITVALTAPVITQQPVPVTAAVGESATFAVAALGGDLSYQWSEGLTPIEGATNPTLTLTNLTLGQSGEYSVLVSNALGTSNSLAALLTVETSVLEHRYSFVSNASDSVGGSAWNGTIVPPNGGGAATIDNGLILPGNAGGGNGVSGYVSLPAGIVKGDNSVSVECWVQPASENTWAEIWDFGSSGSVNFALIEDSPAPSNMRVAFTPNGGEVDIDAPTFLPTGAEQYVAVTYNNSTLTGDLYLNGALDGTVALPNTSYSPGGYGGSTGTTEDTFGNDVYGDPQFGGTIYEVRIWNGVVSPLYIAVSAVAGAGVVVTNLTLDSLEVTVTNATLIGTESEQAAAFGNFPEASDVPITGSITNWSSSNPGILTVNSNGLITAISGGSATISATLDGITGTSASIIVPTNPPVISQQPPPSEILLAGGTLHATVAAIGSEPFTYEWFFNTNAAPISGATSATLTLPDVQSNDVGSYTCVVSNAYGGVTSTPTSLTIVVPTPYQQNLLDLGPLAFWPLNEPDGTTAYDMVGGYNGTYVGGVTLAQPGVTNAALGAPSYSVLFDGATAYVDIPEGPFNITGAITAMAWVNLPFAHGNFAGVFGHGDQSWRFSDNAQGEPGANDGGPPADATDPSSIVDGNWHLLVYTYTGTLTGNNGSLYVDGRLVANNAIATTPAGDDLDVWIGGAPDYGTARLLPGYIADAAIFTEALSAAEVEALYSGGVIVDIAHSGSSIVLTWPSGTLLQAPTVLGPWTTNSAAVSPYTVSATNGEKFYKVQVP